MKKILRTLHTWLSVPLGLFITLVAFSGAMLVFETEVTELCRRDVFFVEHPEGKPLPVDQVLARVGATLPDSVTITGVSVPDEPARTWQVSLSKPRRASLYVNPYTGEVTGRNERLPFFDTMMRLHRSLLGPSRDSDGPAWGKWLVGISTLALVVVLLTGLFLWLPRARRSPLKSLSISVRQGWPRFWHDLHVAGGVYATLFLLALALTGLTWSFAWYRTGFYALFGVEAQAGGAHGGSGHSGGPTEGSPRFARDEAHGGHRRGGHRPDGAPGRRTADSLGIHRAGAETDSTHSRRHGHPAEDIRSTDGEHPRHGGRKDRVPTAVSRPSAGADSLVSDTATAATIHHRRRTLPTDTLMGADEDERSEWAHEHSRRHGDGSRLEEGRHGRRGRHGHRAETADSVALSVTKDSAMIPPAVPVAESRPADHRPGPSASRRSRTVVSSVAEGSADNGRPVASDTLSTVVPEPQSQPFAHWQQVLDTLRSAHADYSLITLSDGAAQVALKSRNSQRATDRYTFDAVDGHITSVVPYAAQERSAKVRGGVYVVHVGKWGGWLTRILTFLSALLGATLPLTGYYLWWRRRWGKKPGGQSASAKPKD